MPEPVLPEMIAIPAGEFSMGADGGEADEGPCHRVFVSEFHIGVSPVTNEEYATFVRQTGCRPPAIYELPLLVTKGGRERERTFRQVGAPYVWPDGRPPPERAHHPVTLVRWDDAAAYCRWLTAETGEAYRLPTEAEWEKAARGGYEGRAYPWGDEIALAQANYLPDPSLKAAQGTTPVRTYPPNGYGLHDMAGNVWEWVADWYDAGYYATSPAQDPPGPTTGILRLVRGGAWLTADVRLLRCAHRHRVPGDTYAYSIGFRVARSGRPRLGRPDPAGSRRAASEQQRPARTRTRTRP